MLTDRQTQGQAQVGRQQSLPELRTCEPTRKGRWLAWASVQLSGWAKGPACCARQNSEQLK